MHIAVRQRNLAKNLHISQSTICRQIKEIVDKIVNKPVCHQMSANTLEKGIKRRYKTWITVNEALFHLSSTTGKMKIQYILHEKRRKDSAVLHIASWPPGVMIWMRMSSHGLAKPFFVET
ncbi:hypothetical protein TNCV_2531741 [Trichonephila clavipes]|nr:hypothetical protein TNCV_2531741 [Trichonephila clavipes]